MPLSPGRPHSTRDPRSPIRPLVVILLLIPLHAGFTQSAASGAPDPAASQIGNGIQQMQRQDPAAAKVQFTQAIAKNPRSADALTWRGIAENQLQQYADAARDFEAALRLQPDAVSAHYNLALSLIRLGESDHAISELRLVVSARPGVFEPEYNLALLLEQKHATSEAIELLQAAYQSHPDDSEVVRHLCLDLVAAGRPGEALPLLNRLREAAPVETLRAVSEALLEAGNYQQTIPLLEKMRAVQPGRPADYLLVRAYIGTHQDSAAIDLLRPEMASDPDGQAAYLMGLAELDTGATEDARSAFEEAVKTNPRSAHALYHLGLIESASPATLSQAVLHLDQALRLEPSNGDYALVLGKALLEQNDARRAMTVLEGIHVPGQREGQRDLLLGIAAIIVNGPPQAIPTLQRAVAADPSLALSYDMLAFCYFSQGDMVRAAQSYAQASDRSPTTLIFAHGAAVAFDRANNPERALTFAARAAALPDASARDHELLGRLLANAGHRDQAITELTRAIAIDPDLEAAYFLLGRTCLQAGDKTQAKVWMDRLQELKQKHQQDSGGTGEREPRLSSSTLLDGAPVAAEPQP